ncbi:MAG: replication-associated recombination protein A [Corallococcus sp.]|nr:replication-associated recombination protein A [Corallococcus sp.]MCM1359133.1 replication-associated recombination protein A [Corallococcus sp.]MCM1394523.1 replication-associated recombination protein A [Corallococcus sp.]
MRPRVLSEFIGQSHIIYDGSLLCRAIKADKLGSCIFWGAPGTGKTSLANVIANTTGSKFEKLNAVSSGVADAKKIIDEATRRFNAYGQKTYLLLDECHRWSKAQSDCVLPAIERGVITLIGSTTENPYVSMTRAIVSRCRVFEFLPLTKQDIKKGLTTALSRDTVLSRNKVAVDDDALEYIAETAAGDLRSAYNALELAALTTDMDADGRVRVTRLAASQSMQKKALSVDTGTYYDMISAFIKSMRGSDANAAMFWFARLIEAGTDPLLLARRIVIHAAEDVGLADPMALPVATAALTAFQNLGLPEGRIPLTEAILYICNCPKSNSVVETLGAATESARQHTTAQVPYYLMDGNHPRTTEQVDAPAYKYPHNYGGWVKQQYLPDEVKDEVYFSPSGNGQDVGCRQKKE